MPSRARTHPHSHTRIRSPAFAHLHSLTYICYLIPFGTLAQARRSHGLEKFIIKNDDRSDMPTSKLDADGDGTYDEVEEVCDTLW